MGWGQGSNFSPRLPRHKNQNCTFPPRALLGTSEFLESLTKRKRNPQLLQPPKLPMLTSPSSPSLMVLEEDSPRKTELSSKKSPNRSHTAK